MNENYDNNENMVISTSDKNIENNGNISDNAGYTGTVNYNMYQGDTNVRGDIVRCSANYATGLTSEQVHERIEKGWYNENISDSGKTVKQIVLENLLTYFNFIFLILAVLVSAVGSFRSLTFMPVIIVNTLIGIIQEIRAKKVLDNLNMLNAPQAKAVRDGQTVKVKSENLVIDDIVIFAAGNQICADAVVVEGEVQVNESLLTGESDEITKKPGDSLMSGSFVVSGECYSRLDKVGRDSYISKLTMEAKTMDEQEQSEMIRSLDKLLKWIGIIIIPIGIVLFSQSFFVNDKSFSSSVTSMVAAVIGMIPEGLYLLATIALAVSSMRLAKRRVLLHNMKSIETLARVNVLCIDKTGTITENKMSVDQMVQSKSFDENITGGKTLEQLLSDFASAMSNDNITMEALQKYFKKGTGNIPISKTSFSSAVKYSSVTYEDGVYVLGAPEMVLREDFANYESEILPYSEKGYRVLVFGKYSGTIDGGPLTDKVSTLGYVILNNAIRKNAPETFKYFEEQGVAIKVISGDTPVTVSEVARQAGIANAEKAIDARELKTEEDICKAVKEYTVFGRVTPNQKRQIIKAFKRSGNTVAMTGDGVNDILALKDADCSIAMASGSEAAAQAAQVVLLDSDFSCMPSVVLEGRRVVNNIERSASLFLVKNIYSFLLAIFSALMVIMYPLEPSQISLITMFTIGIPGFFLAMENNKNRIRGHFIRNVMLRALPAGLTSLISVASLVLFGYVFNVDTKDIATASTILLSMVGFMNLYKISKPLNKLRGAVLGVCIAGLIFCSVFLRDLFAIYGMSNKCIMLFVVFSIATESVYRYITKIFSYFSEEKDV